MGLAPLLGKSSIALHCTEGRAGYVSAFGENPRQPCDKAVDNLVENVGGMTLS
ncbi:hypothetical protein ACNFH5_03885 [Pseudomonas sp. NY15435]|uniref:hypothetical protein n=1 Tax=Pseudomonas sp. NY15435 TaxID=3400358 RepID=UPI003A85F0B0